MNHMHRRCVNNGCQRPQHNCEDFPGRCRLNDETFAPAEAPLAARPPAEQPVVGDAERQRRFVGLLTLFQNCVSAMTTIHTEHKGKAMSDETYSRFAALRDDTIPQLRKELIEFAAHLPPAEQPAPVGEVVEGFFHVGHGDFAPGLGVNWLGPKPPHGTKLYAHQPPAERPEPSEAALRGISPMSAWPWKTSEQPTKAEPVAWGWAIVDVNGDEVFVRPRLSRFFGAANREREPFSRDDLVIADRENPGIAPHSLVTLYAHPSPQPDLTDAEIDELAAPFIREIGGGMWHSGDDGIKDDGDVRAFARAVLAKVGRPEPVKPLTDEQIVTALESAGLNLAYRCFEQDIECARAVELAHGIGTEGGAA